MTSDTEHSPESHSPEPRPVEAQEGLGVAEAATASERLGRDSAESRPVTIMISAGESSGEIHGSALIKAARAKGLDWRFIGLGGDRMAEEEACLIGHVKDTAVMGITEVVGSLRRILAVRSAMKRGLELDRPDALVLIDSPDFNFALAKHAHRLGIPVIYYICPQVWAWREKRLNFLARHTNRRAVIFDFEKNFYESRGVSADWVGHPVLDELPPPAPRRDTRVSLGFEPGRRLLALMPGSRRKVVARLAPGLLKAADLLLDKDYTLQLVLPRADSIEPEFIQRFVDAASHRVRERLLVIPGRSREILAAADLALVASGTSSVEATFLGTPMVVVYQASGLSWFLGRRLIKVKFASIANLVTDREIIPEFLQENFTPEKVAQAAWPLLAGGVARARMIEDLGNVRARLGQPGASGRVVDLIAEELTRRERRPGQ